MSTTVTCPSCRTTLRSNKPLVGNKVVRCPSCGVEFQTSSDAYVAAPEFSPVPPPLPVFTPAAPRQSNLPLILFISGLGAVLAASIALVVWLNFQDQRERNKPAPVASHDPDRHKQLDDEKKRLHDREKQLQEEKERLEQEKRKLDSDRQQADTQSAQARKQLEEIEKATARNTEEKQGRQKEFDRLMQTGKEKMAAKEYEAAVSAFHSAVDLVPDADAVSMLAEARKAAARDKDQQEKLKKYNDLVVAAGKAFQFTLYDDAIAKYQSALEVIPDDPVAMQGLRLARQKKEERDNVENKKQGIGQELTLARNSMNNKRYDEAMAAVDRALKIAPSDADALVLKQLINKQQAEIRMQYLQLMLATQAAYQANRIDDARANFLRLQGIFPGDPITALALDMTVAKQWNYISNMNVGYLALQANRPMDAVRSFAAALMVYPRDPTAVAALAQAERALDKINPQRGNLPDIVTAANQAMQTRQWKEAIRLWESARDQSPLDPLVRTNLAKARYELSMDGGRAAMNARQYAAAVSYFQDALLQHPGDFTANNMVQQATALSKTQPQQPMQVQPNPPAPQAPQVPQIPRKPGGKP